MKCEPDPSWTLLCVEIILPQLKALRKEGEGVKAQRDIENVHRMRVASRRMRAALGIFEGCLSTEEFASWRKKMRNVTRALGEARDADVQIEFLAEFQAGLPQPGPTGVELVLALKRERRQQLQAGLEKALRKLEKRGTILEMEKDLRGMREIALEAGAPGVRSQQSFENAYQEVHARVGALAELEAFVHQEGAIAEHHAMRIAGKRLRYSLEAFSPLFDDGLQGELETLKRLQDLLGEMHDCDIWVSDLGSMLRDLEWGEMELPVDMSPGDVEPGLRLLIENRQEQRRKVYHEFELYWDELCEQGFLQGLLQRMEEAAAEPPDLTSRALEALTADPGIKVAVLGDVHGNVHALRAVLQDARKRGAEVCINTGDFLGYGAEPEEVVRLIRSTPSINIVGNYDLKVFRVHGRGQGKEEGPTGKSLAFQWAYEHISPSSREWLLSLPKEVRLEIGGKRILLVHGSPFCMEEHVGPGTSELRLWEIASSSNADLLIFGHSHQAMSREISGTHFLNPGSVGRQDDGDPRASYAVLRLSPFDAEIYRVDYDMEGAAKAVRSKGLPEVFAQMILQGLSYDQLIGKEAEREALEAEERLEGVRQVSRSYLGEDAHTEQVVRLSAALFDSLAMELSLAQKDRFLLASAALLHDIGWVEGGEGHHKVSQRIILEEEGLSMDRKERIMISCIARYHRKGLPDKRHAHFSTLSKEDRRRVTHLSAILRVADALDRTHGGQVQSLSCELTPGKITVRYTAATDLGAEEAATYQKGDLLEKILERKLEVVRDVG